MNLLSHKSLESLLVVVLLGVLLVSDFLFYVYGKFPASVVYVREILLLAILVAFVPFIRRVKYIKNKAVVTKLRGLYSALASVFLGFVVLKLFTKTLRGILPAPSRSNSLLFGSIDVYLYCTLFSILAAVIMLGVLLILRDLIYFKRKRGVSRNFYLLATFLGLQIIIANLNRRDIDVDLDTARTSISSNFILFLLIVTMIINALRNSWINYLNKKQKINCLWLGIPLIVGAIVFETHIARDEVLREYSVSTASFIESTGLFLCIYLGMSFLSLLLHLPTAGIFDRKIKEIESLHDLSRTLSSEFDSNRIINLITEKAAAIINSDALWLALLNGDSQKLKVVSSEKLEQIELNALNKNSDNGLDGWIMQNRESILINEINKDPRTLSFLSWRRRLGSILGVPLISQRGLLGILYSAKSETFAYDEEDRALLQAFANQAAVALNNVRLFEELVVKERFEQELQVAHDAQRKLLPKQMPDIAGLDIDAVSVTANEVGGDYYDFFQFDGKLAIAVGDVSGKGAKAAFYMAELKGVIESISGIYASPKELTIQANKTICRNLERTAFISLIYLIVDLKKRELVFTRAGHCPLLYCKRGGKDSRFVEPSGLGLGLEPGPKFNHTLTEQKIKVRSGDVIVLYTDGVVEARNSENREFEQERLKHMVSQNAHLSASQIKEVLINEIRKFVGRTRSHDDLTFVVLKIQ
ncbi:SpoIIE family protein phosphatase [candidate division KSB1 bacterium]|nr:SpoIIE family protein phosphatase [candidate division KSB1 bacterium]NIR69838.1 SpoIIE family protein phosphatase [candidate division KSB1 bacterium]NIS24385.1 SpoIIE family protein phosphatase [candidate division KSB1 bacterium]NIT71321.1 SpoIIE family protein phosphatase [candidate division KSB1 bacterium]NIU27616.1 SpoIIE family protein phosphatase [candidate division KSB1 bacterium]